MPLHYATTILSPLPDYVACVEGDIVCTDERNYQQVGRTGIRYLSVEEWIDLYLESGLHLHHWDTQMALSSQEWKEWVAL